MRQFLGNYDDYRYRLQSEREAAATSAPRPPEAAPAVAVAPAQVEVGARTKRQLSKNELKKIRREIADLEEEVGLLETSIDLAGEEMSSGVLAGDDMARAAARVQEQQHELEQKMARWEELNAVMERERG